MRHHSFCSSASSRGICIFDEKRLCVTMESFSPLAVVASAYQQRWCANRLLQPLALFSSFPFSLLQDIGPFKFAFPWRTPDISPERLKKLKQLATFYLENWSAKCQKEQHYQSLKKDQTRDQTARCIASLAKHEFRSTRAVRPLPESAIHAGKGSFEKRTSPAISRIPAEQGAQPHRGYDRRVSDSDIQYQPLHKTFF